MKDDELIRHELQLNNFLAEAFGKHGVKCEIKDNLVLFPIEFMTAHTRLFNRSSSSALILQLDVRLEIGLGREINESCVGLGMNIETAIADAWKNFLQNSFHVLLSAFFTKDFDDQINRYQWPVNGRMYDIVMSHLSVRGQYEKLQPQPWLEQLENLIREQPLTEGCHWIRLYYAQSEHEMLSSEILLDNEIWTSVEKTILTFKFPKHRDFLSVRLFCILRDSFDVSRAAAIMACMAEEDNEAIVERMIEEGFSPIDAEKATVFIPLAFGRVFLKGITKLNFTDEAVITNGKEEQFTINLSDEPIYTNAYQLAEKIMEEGCVDKKQFQLLFTKSAELNAYNNALNEGSKPEDLDNATFSPPMIYLSDYEPPVIEQEEATQTEISHSDFKEQKTRRRHWFFWKKK